MNSNVSLRSRIIHGVSWTMSGHIFSQVLRLGSNLIMTRLLMPEMFGVMAIANTIMVGLHMVSDMGINQHIIQSKRSNDKIFLNTAWVVQILKGLILWCLALIISYIFVSLANNNLWSPDSIYAHSQLPHIIAILSFTAVINGFLSTKWSLANRNLSLHIVIKIELISQILGIGFMIIWAYINRSIWALVGGVLLSVLVRIVSSHVFLPGYNNSFKFDKDSFYDLFHFGKWIFLTSTLGFLAMSGDKIVLAGLINAKLLGVYTIAIFIVNAIQMLINKITNNVGLPALSEVIRNRPHDLKDMYYKFRLPIDALALFTAGVIFISGHHVVDVLYDERYQEAGNMLQILSLLLIFERFSLTGQCFIALGKPSFLIPMTALQVPILYFLLPVVYGQYGLEVTLWVIALSRILEWPILVYFKIKLSIFSLSKEIKHLLFLVLGIFVGWLINGVFYYLT